MISDIKEIQDSQQVDGVKLARNNCARKDEKHIQVLSFKYKRSADSSSS